MDGHLDTVAITGAVRTLTPGGARKACQSYFGASIYVRLANLLPKRDHNDLVSDIDTWIKGTCLRTGIGPSMAG
jgi:hypothetical protein